MLNTEVLNIDPGCMDISLIKKAAGIILAGGLVAFPTETVYGLGANALDTSAIQGIFRAKGRPTDNPLIVHVSSVSQMKHVVSGVSETARKLIDTFWPGPLTLVLEKSGVVPPEVTAGLKTVAVRMPSHPVALSLIGIAGVPIAAPSANLSGKPSATNARHVIDDMLGKVHAIIDSGNCSVGLESTVLDITGETPVILRPGAITKEHLAEITSDVQTAGDTGEEPPRSPGMKHTHYTPNAKVIVIAGPPEKVAGRISKMSLDFAKAGKKVGILATEQTSRFYKDAVVINAGDRANPETIAFNLFSALREFDRLEVDVILAESVETQGLGHAIMNRIYRAAGYNIINV